MKSTIFVPVIQNAFLYFVISLEQPSFTGNETYPACIFFYIPSTVLLFTSIYILTDKKTNTVTQHGNLV